jgi:hypothetical protein
MAGVAAVRQIYSGGNLSIEPDAKWTVVAIRNRSLITPEVDIERWKKFSSEQPDGWRGRPDC